MKPYGTMAKCMFAMLVLASLLLVSCGKGSEPERVAERFLTAYLDCSFQEAEGMALPESHAVEQMRWRASQLTQAEVELLAENESSVEVESMEMDGEQCMVMIMAHDALVPDSIGQPATVGDRRFRVLLSRTDRRRWRVTSVDEVPEP